jgi:MYXO-CTERM domain-containing protein
VKTSGTMPPMNGTNATKYQNPDLSVSCGCRTTQDPARGRLLTLGAGLFAAGALTFPAQNCRLARHTLELTEQDQITDRYTKAIEQLGSDKLDVRIGGIYALERVARDSPGDHPTCSGPQSVIEKAPICAHLRAH